MVGAWLAPGLACVWSGATLGPVLHFPTSRSPAPVPADSGPFLRGLWLSGPVLFSGEGREEIVKVTFEELRQQVALYAAAMRKMGVKKGDRVVGKGHPLFFSFPPPPSLLCFLPLVNTFWCCGGSIPSTQTQAKPSTEWPRGWRDLKPI